MKKYMYSLISLDKSTINLVLHNSNLCHLLSDEHSSIWNAMSIMTCGLNHRDWTPAMSMDAFDSTRAYKGQRWRSITQGSRDTMIDLSALAQLIFLDWWWCRKLIARLDVLARFWNSAQSTKKRKMFGYDQENRC